jgi:hypothetical protein
MVLDGVGIEDHDVGEIPGFQQSEALACWSLQVRHACAATMKNERKTFDFHDSARGPTTSVSIPATDLLIDAGARRHSVDLGHADSRQQLHASRERLANYERIGSAVKCYRTVAVSDD